jgi:cell division protein FtsX
MDNATNISTSEINNFLVRRLGDKEAAEIMDYIHSEVNKQVVAKGDETKNEITLWRNELKDSFATKEDAANMETKLMKRVSAVEGTIILWAFVFWFTLIIAVFIIFKFMH